MTVNQSSRAWVLRLEHRLEPGLANDFVAIGWSDATRLDEIADWDGFKSRILETHPYLEGHNRSLGNGAGSAWRFIHEMQPGDLIAVPTTGGFHLAEIIGDARARYVTDSDVHDCAWRRPVRWITQSALSREYLENYARRRLKARQTCVSADEFVDEFLEVTKREGPRRLVGELRESLRQDVAGSVKHLLDNVGLEHLVCALVNASGALAERMHTRQTAEGDVDVLASVSLPVPELVNEGPSEIRIGYQVKHHEGETDREGLDQLLPRLTSGDLDVGYLVTSAQTFTKDVLDEVSRLSTLEGSGGAESCDSPALKIGLVNRNGLAQWILDVGLERVEAHMPEDFR